MCIEKLVAQICSLVATTMSTHGVEHHRTSEQKALHSTHRGADREFGERCLALKPEMAGAHNGDNTGAESSKSCGQLLKRFEVAQLPVTTTVRRRLTTRIERGLRATVSDTLASSGRRGTPCCFKGK